MPDIDVFVTSIMSSIAIRGRHERVIRGLESLHVPFKTHDVAGSDDAKLYWKRKNEGSTELPCIIVDGKRVGTIEQFDEAVEFDELRQFLGLDRAEAEPVPAPTPPPKKEAPAEPEPKASNDRRGTATLDDFSSLNLTADELAELEREIRAGESFAGAATAEQNFATRTYAPAKELKPDEIKKVRALTTADRKLARDAQRDAMEDMPELSEEDAQALARELDEEDAKRIRQRAESTSDAAVGAKGGAELTAPVEELAKLKLSSEEAQKLKEEQGKSTLAVAATTEAAEEGNPWHDSGDEQAKPKRKTSSAEAINLKKLLNNDNGDTGKGSSELSSFGTERKLASLSDDTLETVDS